MPLGEVSTRGSTRGLPPRMAVPPMKEGHRDGPSTMSPQARHSSESSTLIWVRPPPPARKAAIAKSNSMRRTSFEPNDSASEASVGPAALQYNAERSNWAWKKALLLDQSKERLTIRLMEDNTLLTLPSSSLGQDVLQANEYETDENGYIIVPDDLITLTHLHEPAVVESLQARYEKDHIYTNTGSVLLALNPFQNVRGLYGEAVMKRYWERAEQGLGSSTLPPHVYAIADSAFRSMIRLLEDEARCPHQSILVSGESGAGKTVTTKFVMKYLAALSQRSAAKKAPAERAYKQVNHWKQLQRQQQTQQSQTANAPPENWSSLTLLPSQSIEGQVLQSNPILESFGNARTVRNDNSSRFGKFIEIQFSGHGQLVGASVDTYLLEKVRLVHQSVGERNYHIFYELLSGGMDARQLSHYFIAGTAGPEDFKLTASGTYDRRDGVSDQETYYNLRLACTAMKFTNIELHQVFCVTAALLHASNLTLEEDPTQEASWLDPHNVHLAPVCHLLAVAPEALQAALCEQSLVVRNQVVTRSLNIERAIKGLEALVKAIYGALFEYLVQRINDSIAYREEDSEMRAAASVRVLDIFGFESFAINSLEQLCINYCNEALQQQFNAFVLKNEQAEYEREGIEWSFVSYQDNGNVLELIEKRGAGLLSLLDDQCKAPGPSDKAFWWQIFKQCKTHERCQISQQTEGRFSINHYAGKVEYTVTGFVEKNRNELSKEGTELIKNSSNPFVQLLAEILEESQEIIGTTPQSPQLRRADSTVGRVTVGGQFRRQLRDLRQKIDETTPHYIRCLKPNDMLVANHMDSGVVAEQLRCGGILEAVRVARAGFTQHYPLADFVRRYRNLCWNELAQSRAMANSHTHHGRSPRGMNYRHNPYHNQPSPAKSSGQQCDTKTQCKEIIRILVRKVQELLDEDDGDESNNSTQEEERRALSHSYNASGWRQSRSSRDSQARKTQSSNYRNRGVSDNTRVGIQMGKTKVFLRHKAFEALERIRSKELTKAATKLNNFFRMYLAKMAFLPYRNAFRRELNQRRQIYEREDDYKESKEDFFDDTASSVSRFRKVMRNVPAFASESLVDKWVESQIRNAIHNPVPRHEWGKAAPSHREFKWALVDGIWVRNFQ